jgi:molybdate transport system ATP-binding protein
MFEVRLQKQLGRFTLDVEFGTAGSGITALFGRSGAGKSSVVAAIAGLLQPDSGAIRLNGNAFFDSLARINVPAERRRIGYVFQDGRLFPHLSVEANLRYGWHRVAPAERTVDFNVVVDLLGIGHLLDRKPLNLSGGEKQRVAIGRALLASPRLLLMDEPLAALDRLRKAEILQYIELLRDEMRIPIVYVSHALEEVMRLADAVVTLDEGRVTHFGSPAEVMAALEPGLLEPGDEESAVIEAEVAGYDAEYGVTTLRFAGGELSAVGVDALPGARVRVRIRARDVAVALQPPVATSVNNILAGTVVTIRRDDPLVMVSAAVGQITLLASITRRSAERLALRPGTPVYLMLKSVSLDRAAMGYA